MQRRVPNVNEGSLILLWRGGIPKSGSTRTVIHAVAEVGRADDRVRLVFIGLSASDPRIEEMEMTKRALCSPDEARSAQSPRRLQRRLGTDDERGRWLLEADVGVSAHFDDVGARFSFRTRMVDYFWTGSRSSRPKVSTIGDLVEREGAGRTVPIGDTRAWSEAIRWALDKQSRAGTRRVRRRCRTLPLDTVVEPCGGFCATALSAATEGAVTRRSA